jgi:hypothetical protein
MGKKGSNKNDILSGLMKLTTKKTETFLNGLKHPSDKEQFWASRNIIKIPDPKWNKLRWKGTKTRITFTFLPFPSTPKSLVSKLSFPCHTLNFHWETLEKDMRS